MHLHFSVFASKGGRGRLRLRNNGNQGDVQLNGVREEAPACWASPPTGEVIRSPTGSRPLSSQTLPQPNFFHFSLNHPFHLNAERDLVTSFFKLWGKLLSLQTSFSIRQKVRWSPGRFFQRQLELQRLLFTAGAKTPPEGFDVSTGLPHKLQTT